MIFGIISCIFLMGLVRCVPAPAAQPTDLEYFKILKHNGPLKEDELGINFNKIKTLEIQYSKLAGFSKETLRRFKNLENLTIASTHMGKVEDDVFTSCCPKLKHLKIFDWIDFEENDLKGIGSLHLEDLDILDQDIPVLKSNIFKNTNLKNLLLVRNNIRTIEDGAFSNLHNLEYLLISNNKIKSIPKQALAPLKKLDTLEWVSNGLEKFSTASLPDLPSLTELVIIRENLTEVNLEGIQNVAPKLDNVYLIGNKGVHDPKISGHARLHNWI